MQIDHLILGIGDLEHGVAEVEQNTGVRPGCGRGHPGRGTHNALASLGDGQYLEILAPTKTAPSSPAIDEFRRIERLTPAGWAVATTDIDATARFLKAAGYE